MSAPNPYEPPHEPESLTTSQTPQHRTRARTVIILTPVAVIAAAAIGFVADLIYLSFLSETGRLTPMLLDLQLIILALPPCMTLAAMIYLIYRLSRIAPREHDD